MNDFKVRSDWMPFCVPDISDAEVQAVSDTVRSGWWAKGPRTIEFEKRFAEYVGAKYCVGVNSCTAALHLALMTQGIGPGDEVITTPLTFASSANTILHVGATPVFADIDPETGLIDPKEIEKKITDKTRAVVPVHYSGLAADIGEIGRLCDRYGLFLSEDAAHAVETRYNGELIGHHPQGAVSYSFYATKNLACGEGGALVTDDDEIAARARVLSCHGMTASHVIGVRISILSTYSPEEGILLLIIIPSTMWDSPTAMSQQLSWANTSLLWLKYLSERGLSFSCSVNIPAVLSCASIRRRKMPFIWRLCLSR